MRCHLQKDHLKHNLPLEQQTDPSPRPSPSPIIPDPIPETSGGNLGGHSSSDKSLSGNEGEMTLQSVYDLCLSLCAQVTDQAKEIQHLKAQIKKLKKQAKPVIHHHRAWLKSVSLKQRLTRKSFPKKQRVHKESVSNQGRKLLKECSDKGRYNDIVDEDKEIEENVLSTEDVLSTDKDKVSTDKEKVSTDRPMVSTDGSKVSTDRQVEGTDEQIEGTEEQIESTDGKRKGTEEGSATQLTQIPTSTIFGDDETIAKVLLNTSQAKAVSREKEKAKMIQKTKEEEIKKRLNLKENSESDIDFLLRTLQEPRKERNLTIDRKSKVPVMTQFAPKKIPLLNKIRSNRNRPLTKNQLRNQMMTYLKHVGNFKHAELKIKKFEEVQALYEKIKRSDEDFISIGSAEDERLIQRMNEKGVDSSKDEMIKEESKEEVKKESKAEVQEKSKEEESKRKRKFGTRKKIKSRKRRYIQNTSEDDSDKENDELRLHLTIAPDEKKEVDYEILDRKYPIKEWKTKCLGTKPQADKAEHLEEINQNVVIRSNGQKRYFSTLMRVLSIFDREDLNAVYQLVMDRFQDEIPKGSRKRRFKQDTSEDDEKENDELRLCLTIASDKDKEVDYEVLDKKYPIIEWKTSNGQRRYFSTLMRVLSIFDREDLNAVYQLVMDRYQDEIPKGFDRVLWGDLMIMFNPSDQDEFWSLQQDWNVYPLRKKVLLKMLKLKLESEEDNTMVINAPCYDNKALTKLAIPEQTATGKGTSNPLMAGSLSKTTKPT
ncbi:hypothetical protein Tco_0140548 [Tanacetum coccineum]